MEPLQLGRLTGLVGHLRAKLPSALLHHLRQVVVEDTVEPATGVRPRAVPEVELLKSSARTPALLTGSPSAKEPVE